MEGAVLRQCFDYVSVLWPKAQLPAGRGTFINTGTFIRKKKLALSCPGARLRPNALPGPGALVFLFFLTLFVEMITDYLPEKPFFLLVFRDNL